MKRKGSSLSNLIKVLAIVICLYSLIFGCARAPKKPAVVLPPSPVPHPPHVELKPLEKIVRIGIRREEKPLTLILSSDSDFKVIDGITNLVISEAYAEDPWTLRSSPRGIEVFSPKWYSLGDRFSFIKIRPVNPSARVKIGPKSSLLKRYRGIIEVHFNGSYLVPINELGLEDYLLGVVPQEMDHRWEREALKAQAVVARTYTLSNLNIHQNEGFNLCDGVHCQVYGGYEAERERTNEAVKATKGVAMFYLGGLIHAFYHSTCGGHTANNEDVWINGRAYPYLRGVADGNGAYDFCHRSPYYQWSRTHTSRELGSVLATDPNTSPGSGLKQLEVLNYDISGRAKKILIVGSQSRIVSGNQFRLVINRTLGRDALPSTRSKISNTGNAYTFVGKGYGHGVGMCQWGAKGMAEEGYFYEKILLHYFPGVSLSRID